MGSVGGRIEFDVGGGREVVVPGCPAQLISVATTCSGSIWELVADEKMTELDGVHFAVHVLVMMALTKGRRSNGSLNE